MLYLFISIFVACDDSNVIVKGDTGCEPTAEILYCIDIDKDGAGSNNPDDCLYIDPCDVSPYYVSNNNDCNDLDDNVRPNASEACNDLDDDCDGSVDNGLTSVTSYADMDGDGYGDEAASETDCDVPTGYVEVTGDCDDTEAAVNPDASEVCDDALDNDCDGGVDDLSSCVDADNDGYTADVDCDDSVARVNPGARETCNEIDDNCDGEVDEGVQRTFYADTDGDGYGDDSRSVESCKSPDGYVSYGGDCDDTDAAYNPGADESDCTDPNDYNCDGSVGEVDADGDGYAACEECDDTDAAVNPDGSEVCNDVDDDCDGVVDDDATDASTWYEDADDDGYGNPSVTTTACDEPEGYVGGDSDCDDEDSGTNPGALEVCDSADNDCDAETDEEAADASVWYIDADGDGYGEASATTNSCEQPEGYSAYDTDCDDTDAAYNPGADESDCTDGNDYNCDGSSARTDDDGDGYAACEECDDSDAFVNPGEDELCDGEDNDCDGTTDGSDAVDASIWYADVDGDGYGSATDSTVACSKPAGYTTDSTDCDDRNDEANPGELEVCDGSVDEDCDGEEDEDDASDATTWYRDADNDGYGDALDTKTACEEPSGYTRLGTDCDDSYNDAYPGNVEWCDGVDNDCFGAADDGDYDGDGYAVCDDCDDEESALNPGQDELCDGEDNDCDGTVDEDAAVDASTWYEDADEDGYGSTSSTTTSCDEPAGYVSDASDCDDSDADVNPDGLEIELVTSTSLVDNCGDAVDNDCDGSVDSVDWDCDDYDGDGNANAIDPFVPYDADGDGYDDTLFTVSALVFSGSAATSSVYVQGDTFASYSSISTSFLDTYGTVTIGGETVGGLSRDVSGESAGFSSAFRYVVASSSTAVCTDWEIMDASDYCSAQDNGTLTADEFCWYQSAASGGACSASLGWTAIVQWNGTNLYGN